MPSKRQSNDPLRRSKRLRQSSQGVVTDDINGTDKFGDSIGRTSPSSVSDDQFDLLDVEYPVEGGEDCELHIYHSRHDTRGELVLLRAGTNLDITIPKVASNNAGFVVIKSYSPKKTLLRTRLEIRSPYFQKAMREVIKSYPGVSINPTGVIVLHDLPRCLFHYQDELSAYAESQTNPRFKEHIRFGLKYMRKVLSRELGALRTCVNGNADQAGLEYKDLWMVYRPGSYAYRRIRGNIRIGQVKSVEWKTPPNQNDDLSSWEFSTYHIYCDGQDLVRVLFFYHLPKYDGVKCFDNLDISPLDYHPQRSEVRKDLVARGKLYVSVAGVHYCHYTGNAHATGKRYVGATGSSISSLETIRINERIVLDEETFQEYFPALRSSNECAVSQADFTEGDYLICVPEIGGYTLGTKLWALFDVGKIEKLQPDKDAFDRLSLAPNTKSLIISLVRTHGSLSTPGNIIKEKGKGLIFLLQGPPGVGKTFTAESIADHTNRPLYRLDSHTVTVESELTMALALAQKWGAIVLLDEADVFMQRRDFHDLHRNSVVSMLLRHIEYFGGVMFLTTNQPTTIDEAFRSRIHLTVSYPQLSEESRKGLWEKGLINEETAPQWLTPRFLDRLSSVETNGRVINNAIYMAQILALNEKRDMTGEDVMKGLQEYQLDIVNT